MNRIVSSVFILTFSFAVSLPLRQHQHGFGPRFVRLHHPVFQNPIRRQRTIYERPAIFGMPRGKTFSQRVFPNFFNPGNVGQREPDQGIIVKKSSAVDNGQRIQIRKATDRKLVQPYNPKVERFIRPVYKELIGNSSEHVSKYEMQTSKNIEDSTTIFERKLWKEPKHQSMMGQRQLSSKFTGHPSFVSNPKIRKENVLETRIKQHKLQTSALDKAEDKLGEPAYMVSRSSQAEMPPVPASQPSYSTQNSEEPSNVGNMKRNQYSLSAQIRYDRKKIRRTDQPNSMQRKIIQTDQPKSMQRKIIRTDQPKAISKARYEYQIHTDVGRGDHGNGYFERNPLRVKTKRKGKHIPYEGYDERVNKDISDASQTEGTRSEYQVENFGKEGARREKYDYFIHLRPLKVKDSSRSTSVEDYNDHRVDVENAVDQDDYEDNHPNGPVRKLESSKEQYAQTYNEPSHSKDDNTDEYYESENVPEDQTDGASNPTVQYGEDSDSKGDIDSEYHKPHTHEDYEDGENEPVTIDIIKQTPGRFDNYANQDHYNGYIKKLNQERKFPKKENDKHMVNSERCGNRITERRDAYGGKSLSRDQSDVVLDKGNVDYNKDDKENYLDVKSGRVNTLARRKYGDEETLKANNELYDPNGYDENSSGESSNTYGMGREVIGKKSDTFRKQNGQIGNDRITATKGRYVTGNSDKRIGKENTSPYYGDAEKVMKEGILTYDRNEKGRIRVHKNAHERRIDHDLTDRLTPSRNNGQNVRRYQQRLPQFFAGKMKLHRIYRIPRGQFRYQRPVWTYQLRRFPST